MTEEIKNFLLKANTYGYGSDLVNEQKLPNGETIIHFSNEQFELKDVYYGGEPYAGQEVIFKKGGRAVWAMQYRGEIIGGYDFAPIYQFLGKVLTNTKVGLPRGVDGFSGGDFRYEFNMDGGLDNFSASEKIFCGDEVVYLAHFLGGLVDIGRGEV